MPVVELVQMKGPWGKTKSLGGEVAQRGRGDSTEASPPRRGQSAPWQVNLQCVLTDFQFTPCKHRSHRLHGDGSAGVSPWRLRAYASSPLERACSPCRLLPSPFSSLVFVPGCLSASGSLSFGVPSYLQMLL